MTLGTWKLGFIWVFEGLCISCEATKILENFCWDVNGLENCGWGLDGARNCELIRFGVLNWKLHTCLFQELLKVFLAWLLEILKCYLHPFCVWPTAIQKLYIFSGFWYWVGVWLGF